MTEQGRCAAHACIPLLYHFLYDAVGRIVDLTNTNEFRFIINGKVFASSLVEAVLISPAVHVLALNDLSVKEFRFNDDGINCDDFQIFHDIIRNGRIHISHSNVESLINLSRRLQNDRLELLFKSISMSMAKSKSTEAENGIDIDCGRGIDVNVELIASQFFSYSKETLSSFGLDFLNEIVSNEHLCLLSEDALLRMIVSLGDDYRSLLNHIRIDFLSSSGLHEFLTIISWSDICESQWRTIASVLKVIEVIRLQSAVLWVWADRLF
jgi:hypothetical protein